jgi:RimJ/RimL family protein N-acetyltransferase
MAEYPPMSSSLETERLRLRSWTAADAEDLRALHAERENATPETAEQMATLMQTIAAVTARDGITTLPLVLRETGEFLGYCGLIIGRATIQEPEIAYELFRRFHGHGYATEAARAVLAAATATGRERLWSTVRSWNKPSFRVLEKLGFERHHSETDDRGDLVWLTRAL